MCIWIQLTLRSFYKRHHHFLHLGKSKLKVLRGVKQGSLLFVLLFAVQHSRRSCHIKPHRALHKAGCNQKTRVLLFKYTILTVYMQLFSHCENQHTLDQYSLSECIIDDSQSLYWLLIHSSSVVKHVGLIFSHWFNLFILYSANTSSTSLAYYWFSHYTFLITRLWVLNTKSFFKKKNPIEQRPTWVILTEWETSQLKNALLLLELFFKVKIILIQLFLFNKCLNSHGHAIELTLYKCIIVALMVFKIRRKS